jgi:hypothetical protein
MLSLEPVCPFDGALLDRHWKDCDGYTMCICPTCDARFRADAWVDPSAGKRDPGTLDSLDADAESIIYEEETGFGFLHRDRAKQG